jgi:hypothetical protein
VRSARGQDAGRQGGDRPWEAVERPLRHTRTAPRKTRRPSSNGDTAAQVEALIPASTRAHRTTRHNARLDSGARARTGDMRSPTPLQEFKADSVTRREFRRCSATDLEPAPQPLARAARSDLHVWADPAGARLANPASREAEFTLSADAPRQSRARTDLRRPRGRRRPREATENHCYQPIRGGR